MRCIIPHLGEVCKGFLQFFAHLSGSDKASPSGRGVTEGDGEGKDADNDLRAQR